MAWIDLKVRGNTIDRFVLPQDIAGPADTVFRLYRAVRQGGNGVVFEARHLNRSGGILRTCALKLLKEQDESRIDRFNNEVRVLSSLASPRVSQFYGSGEIDLDQYSVPWIAMELGGPNLREHVKQSGPLGRSTLRSALLQIVDAVEHVHENGFIHRDIKPENFVFASNGSSDVLMIDFGLAKRVGEDVSARPLDNFTKHTEFVGPVFFSSPELIAYASDKRVAVDKRSDLFQVGKVAWFLATGTISAGVPSRRQCPFGGSLCDIVREALADDPEERPSSAGALRALILALMA